MNLRRVYVALTAVAVLATTITAASTAGATGGTPSSHKIGGYEGVVGCMTPTVCVVGGYNIHSVGNLITVHAGVPKRIVDVPMTQGVYQVSCPNASGCVAMLRTSNDIGVRFVTLNAAGAITKNVLSSVPNGVILSQLVCSTTSACVVGGTQVFKKPEPYEVGTWSGGKLTLHSVAAPAKTTNTIINNLACFRTFCDAVGYVQRIGSSVTTGVSVAITNGIHFQLHTLGSNFPYGISCVSMSVCYADGFSQTGGVVITLHNGAMTSSAATVFDLYGIACAGSKCTAAGKQTAPSGSKQFYWGDVVPVVNGTPGTAITVPQTVGFESIAAVGGDYTAVGLWQGAGSDVTTNG